MADATQPLSFTSALMGYSTSIDSLRDFVDLVHTHLAERKKQTLEEQAGNLLPFLVIVAKLGLHAGFDAEEKADLDELAELLADEISVETFEEGDKKRLKIDMSPDLQRSFSTGMRAYGRAHERTVLLYNGSLMNLASLVELLFANLFRIFFARFPGAVGTSDKVFSFEDLTKFDSVSAAREHYVASRIEALLFAPFVDWIEFLRSKAKLSMGYLGDAVDLLVETFQRRNLVVHNAGIVNSIYLSGVHPRLLVDVKLGQHIPPDREYLLDRIDLFETYGLLVAAELWKKLSPADDDRGAMLGAIIYEHLRASRWSVAASLAQFVIQDRQLPEASRCVASLNNWLCHKRLGQWENVEEEVRNADFSARSLRYQLGLFALRGESDRWFELVPKALQVEEVTLKELNEFPIFEEVRGDPRFQQYRETSTPDEAPGRKPPARLLRKLGWGKRASVTSDDPAQPSANHPEAERREDTRSPE